MSLTQKSWIETERGAVMVEFSRNMACYVWTCIYGHSDFDYESEAEATAAFLAHECVA